MQIVMIDTVLLAGLTHPTERSRPPAAPTDLPLVDKQLAWIEETLSASKATWLYVCGHYPGKLWTSPRHPVGKITECC